MGPDVENYQPKKTTTPAAQWRENGEADPHGHTDYYKGERASLAKGNLTDDQLANEVFLHPGIANLTAAKERIRWLSRALESALNCVKDRDVHISGLASQAAKSQ